MEKKLQRIPHEGAVAGVCAGLGVYFGVDKTWVRLAFIISVFFSGYMGIGLLGPIVYIILWIVLPVKPFALPQDPFNVDYRAQPNQPSEDFAGYGPSTWGNTTKPYRSAKNTSKDRYMAGLFLVVLGVLFLLHQLDIFYWRDFARFWPILIIIFGLATILGAFKQPKPSVSTNDPDKQAESRPHGLTPDSNTEDGRITPNN